MELPYERAAMRGEPIPDGLKLTDQKMYMALRMLYKQYYDGLISREQAVQDKQALVAAYEAEAHFDSVYEYTVGLWRRIDIPGKEYVLCSNPDTADNFFAAVYGLPPDWRSERVAGKEVRNRIWEGECARDQAI